MSFLGQAELAELKRCMTNSSGKWKRGRLKTLARFCNNYLSAYDSLGEAYQFHSSVVFFFPKGEADPAKHYLFDDNPLLSADAKAAPLPPL